ncbi:TonB-dependent receptor [Thiosocius teredinicola]|uniref:TonB-dependent receptor n=1 Tax=Thiosocius teredinicola TaxID=1973002 RepID=UPI000991251A
MLNQKNQGTPLSLRRPRKDSAPTLSSLALAISSSLSAGIAHSADANPATDATLDKLTVEEKVEAEKNPHAEPGAPYKVNTLSSPKYTRPISETPKTVTVIPKEAIEDSGNTDLADVLRAQPGITIGTGEGGNAFGDRYIIRGFEARNDVFVDGLRDPGVTTRETFAVEQIEISKGPSSSFAGRGTTGGAINNVTKKPSDFDFTRAQISVGTDNKQRYTIDNNFVLNRDIAIRTNLLYADRDVPDRGWASEERKGAAVAVDWWATDKLKFVADYYYLRGEDVPDGGVPWDSVEGEPVSGSKFYGQKGRDFWDTGSDIATLSAEYHFTDAFKVTNQTRHGKTTNEYVVTIPGLRSGAVPGGTPIGVSTPGVFVAASSQNRNQENTYLGNQTNFQWDTELADMRHTFVFGFEFSKEEAENLPYSDSLRSPNAGDPNNPNNYAWLQGGGTLVPNTDRYAELEVKTRSLWLMDTVTINDDWEVFAGLRHDSFDYRVNSGPTAYTGGTDGEVTNDESFLNGHFGVTYSPWANGNVYLAYSTSSNPTGEQFDAFTNCAYGGLCEDANGEFPSPEKNTNIEIGTKWELMDHKLLFTAAVFQVTKEDVISSSGGRGAPVVLTQVGEMRVRGLELGLTGNITPKLSLFAGATFMDTEITESDDPDEIGDPFPNTAETSANVQLRYQATPEWAIGGTVTYTGEISGGTPNGAPTDNTIDANTRLDLMTEYAFSKNLKARVNVLNVTDEEYYDALYRSGAPFTYIGEGRSATLTLDYTF